MKTTIKPYVCRGVWEEAMVFTHLSVDDVPLIISTGIFIFASGGKVVSVALPLDGILTITPEGI